MPCVRDKLSGVKSSAQRICGCFLLLATMSGFGQIQQAWVAKYNNGITNGNHQGLKMTLDSSGNIYVLGVSQNANTNTGYVTIKYAPSGTPIWVARFDTTNFSNASPTAFALDSSNNVIITGNAGTVKYDINGNQVWIAPYSGAFVAVDGGGNVIVTGLFTNFTTVKLNPAGSNLWTATFNGQGMGWPNTAQRVIVDAAGNIYVSGSETYVQYPNNGGLYTGPATVKYDTNGNFVWATSVENEGEGLTQIGGSSLDSTGRLNVLSDTLGAIGRRYLTQQFTSFGTNRWTTNVGGGVTGIGYDLKLDGADNVIITGSSSQFYPNYGYSTSRLDTNGNILWIMNYPSNPIGTGSSTALAIDNINNIYITGYSPFFGTSNDVVTIKYGPNGNQIWLQRYNGPANGDDEGNAIAVDNNGNVYVAGYETETNGFTGMVLIKYSPVTVQRQSNGNFILQAYGSPGENFDIQASTNLQTWQDLGHVIADTNGFAQFADTNASNFNARFYYTVPQ